jgi:enoyl-CoA hydratase/carnithine racemase
LRVGLGHAKDLVLTGRTLTAKEAKDIGLVNAVIPDAQLLDHALSVARTIAQKAPLAVAGAKASLDHGYEADLPRGLAIEQDSVVLLFATQDKKEGLDAFVERRTPAFTGR